MVISAKKMRLKEKQEGASKKGGPSPIGVFH